ncbi:hypothetical protein Godav_014102 [Gossypium davidsonii]|uniref:RNase H type-1 domain-containing protein n=2 Tax=Gossypium TaxID=3633 RepID=A0A7J8RIQ7_GOSDV|nr:hypothetical protein [Gossypium davidsonii]MBA0648898.1 hypothetical protein [Gossypium klotzschianum]
MVYVRHVFREENKIANGLTKMMFSRLLRNHIYMEPPKEVLQLLHDD